VSTSAAHTDAFERLLASAPIEELAASLRSGLPAIVLSGLASSARALIIAALEKKTARQIIFVARSARQLEEIRSDVEFFFSALNPTERDRPLITLPASERDPYDGTSPHAEVLEQRALALYQAAQGSADSPRIIITSLRALLERTVPPSELRSSGITLRVGEQVPPESVVDLLIASGYLRQEPVTAVGEFSMRGGILDVFSPLQEAPHRIEFFGDTIDSIREFDSDTQRSIKRISESAIAPMRELSIRREDFLAWADEARRRWSDERFHRERRARLAHAERGEPFPGWEYLIPITRPLTASAFDYFKDAVLVIDEPAEIEKSAALFYKHLAERFSQAEGAGELALPPESLFLTPEELRSHLATAQRVEMRLLGRTGEVSHSGEVSHAICSPESGNHYFPIAQDAPDIQIICESPRRYHGRFRELARELESNDSSTVLFVMPSIGLAERVTEVLGEYEIPVELALSLPPKPGACSIRRIATVGKLSSGFALPGIGLWVLVESDLFGDQVSVRQCERAALQLKRHALRKQRSLSATRRRAAFLSDLSDLKVGDYVVHIDHGIGQFQGLRQIAVASNPRLNLAEGIERGLGLREFMLITYAEGAKLYVPVERLDLVQKYSSAEGHQPQLDRLGGTAWQRAKARARRAMRRMAEELLKLYAERKLVQGYAYGPDTPWQREFEDAFCYQLTPDQESAIEDVKADMEKPEPMDRLIVGDVGYGKTEVAMRAAFKAVMEGKQVAVLAPTTVLVYQHFKTFQQRFGPFPVRIEMLSRFRTAKQQREIIKAIEAGAVDIVIGTHRLLSKDVRFRNLGLLVIDEEQRFGVAHKERIKQMRKKVDVIAMSATPIPRTLNMSLAGLRDMSLIETPPRDRLAIQTQVVQFSESVIRSAIELELERGGQVFFVHNRVETIYEIAELVSRLVPGARIGVGHGQMSERQLEEVMLRFIRHELDVLVSTTIIENGIDIPLANTIIINRADTYGLAQLYQLRGRVGRSNRRAYAYLLIPSEEKLTAIARRRLAAIREFSELGAGFRLAALDLELRGAGNLLGPEQSGHIDAIGFDLYTRLLERTVRELKGEIVEDEAPITINLGAEIRIPEEYIFDMSQRLSIYKRISSAEDEADLADIHSEVEDRYGPIPEAVERLFDYSRLRREAARLGVISIDREGDRLAVKFAESARIDPGKLVALVSSDGASFSPAGVLKIRLASQDDAAIFTQVRELLSRLQ
jgi:transcription-repair coupling factor (superfamily II helicase)